VADSSLDGDQLSWVGANNWADSSLLAHHYCEESSQNGHLEE